MGMFEKNLEFILLHRSDSGLEGGEGKIGCAGDL